MKSHKVKFKQDNMLCHRCVMNAVKTLNQLREIDELSVDFSSKIVKVVYRDDKISREMIKEAVNESIVRGKIKNFKF